MRSANAWRSESAAQLTAAADTAPFVAVLRARFT